ALALQIGQANELEMDALHVVTLAEGIHDDFPVALQRLADIDADGDPFLHPIRLQRLQRLLRRAEEFRQRRCFASGFMNMNPAKHSTEIGTSPSADFGPTNSSSVPG